MKFLWVTALSKIEFDIDSSWVMQTSSVVSERVYGQGVFSWVDKADFQVRHVVSLGWNISLVVLLKDESMQILSPGFLAILQTSHHSVDYFIHCIFNKMPWLIKCVTFTIHRLDWRNHRLVFNKSYINLCFLMHLFGFINCRVLFFFNYYFVKKKNK